MQKYPLAQPAQRQGQRRRVGSLRKRSDFVVAPLKGPIEHSLDVGAKAGVGNA